MQTTPSVAAQVIITIIPIVGIVMGSLVIFFYFYWNHKQRMLMIEKGLLAKRTITFDLTMFSLFLGLLLCGIGASISIFFIAKEGISWGLLSGFIPLSIGLSLLIYYKIVASSGKNRSNAAG